MIMINKRQFKHFLLVADYIPEIKNPSLIKDAQGIKLSLDKLFCLLNDEEINKMDKCYGYTEEEMILCLQLSTMMNYNALNGFIEAIKSDDRKEIILKFEGDID